MRIDVERLAKASVKSWPVTNFTRTMGIVNLTKFVEKFSVESGKDGRYPAKKMDVFGSRDDTKWFGKWEA